MIKDTNNPTTFSLRRNVPINWSTELPVEMAPIYSGEIPASDDDPTVTIFLFLKSSSFFISLFCCAGRQWSQNVGAGGPHHAPMWEDTQSSAPCRCVPTSSLRFHAFGCWAKIEIVYYMPRRTMKVIAWRATMLAGDRSRGTISPVSIVASPAISWIIHSKLYSKVSSLV